jgi:hypothetical protein
MGILIKTVEVGGVKVLLHLHMSSRTHFQIHRQMFDRPLLQSRASDEDATASAEKYRIKQYYMMICNLV